MSRVNPNFPIPGIDQSSKGFRDNFSIIKQELENIQNKQIQLVGNVTSNISTFGSGSGPVIINTYNETISYSNLPAQLQNSLSPVMVPGSMPTNQKVLILPIVQNTEVPANFAGSNGYCFTTSTSSFTFNVSYVHNGSPISIGNVTFNSGSHIPVFSTQANIILINGDTFYVSTGTTDATLADVGITFLLLKQ